MFFYLYNNKMFQILEIRTNLIKDKIIRSETILP